MTVTNADILKQSARQAGANPKWNDSENAEQVLAFSAATAAPASASDGFPVNGELVAMVAADLNVQPGIWRATIVPTTVADSTAYKVTIDGTTCTYTSDGSATHAEITAGLHAAIVAAGLAGISSTDEDLDGDGSNEVVIRSTDKRPHVVLATAETTVTPEPTRTKFRAWGYPTVAAATETARWRSLMPFREVPVDAAGVVTAEGNVLARVSVAGMARVAFEIVETDGAGNLRLALCQAEA